MDKELRIKVQAGVMIPRCPIVFTLLKGQKERCFGHQHIPLSLDEVASIRAGKNKAVDCHFSCGHTTYDKIIVEA